MVNGQLPWTPDQEADLLSLVIAKGGHLAKDGTTEKTKIWSEIYDDFWNQDSMKDYKAAEVKKNGDKSGKKKIRKIVEKYVLLIKNFQKKLGWGDFYGGNCENLSGHTGDLARVASSARQILNNCMTVHK